MGTTTEDSAQLTCMRRAKAYRAVTFCQTNERQHRHARIRGQMCSWHYVIPQRYLNCSMRFIGLSILSNTKQYWNTALLISCIENPAAYDRFAFIKA